VSTHSVGHDGERIIDVHRVLIRLTYQSSVGRLGVTQCVNEPLEQNAADLHDVTTFEVHTSVDELLIHVRTVGRSEVLDRKITLVVRQTCVSR